VIRVQQEDFSVDQEYQKLRETQGDQVGAICTFTGLVRDFGDRDDVTGIFLEHYPGMTESSLQGIVDQAKGQWQLHDVTIIHRIGDLDLRAQIVFVGVSASHRGDAFAACEFIMDYLKVEAPFWKKERSTGQEQWVEAKLSDSKRAKKWQA